MAEAPAVDHVICVHCRKPFRAEVLAAQTVHAGLKCPHCKLFMPLQRVATDEGAAA